MYKISEDTVNALIQYLSHRPYAEVVEGIKLLTSLEKLDE